MPAALLLLFLAAAAAAQGGRNGDLLTPAERLWLEQNRDQIAIAFELNYAPFSFLDAHAQPAGLTHDYLFLVESRLGVHFRRIYFPTLDELLGKVRTGEGRFIVNALTNTPQRRRFIAFTEPFIAIPNVIITRHDREQPLREDRLSGLKVSLVKSYAVTDYLLDRKLGFVSDLVADDLTALLNVSFERSDAAVLDLATVTYLISQKGISNLTVAGETGFSNRLAMGASISEPVLRDILQKGLSSIGAEERKEIERRWFDTSPHTVFADWRLWAGFLGAFLLLLAVTGGVILWNRTLRREVGLRTEALSREKDRLRESEARFRTLFENSPVSLLEEDFSAVRGRLDELARSGVSDFGAYFLGHPEEVGRLAALVKICDFNGQTVSMLQADSRDDVLRNLSGYFTRESLAVFREELLALAKGATDFQAEIPVVNRKGKKILLALYVAVLPEHRNNWSRILVTLLDITERKRIMEELRMTRASVEAASDAVYWIASGARIADVNPAACRLLGYSREEMLRMTVAELDPLFDPEHWERAVFPVLRTRGSLRFESVHRARDGRVIPVEVAANYFLFDGEEVLCAFARDLSERKKAEEEKKKLEEQLFQSQKLESIGRLAGGVAHDFNNMLSVILGQTEVCLAEIEARHPLGDHLNEIRSAAERSADLTRQLLAFARRQTISPQAVDLNGTVSAMRKMLQRLIGEDIRLTWQAQADLWAIRIDPSQLHQILVNLCVNARDAIRDKGQIGMEGRNCVLGPSDCEAYPDCSPGEYVRLSVADSGCGMDKETLSHIFEPFYTTKGVGEGTGLGLATVFGIVTQNRGFLRVQSEPGKGTVMDVYLPRSAEAVAPPPAEAPVLASKKGSETILLVEDEPAILKTAKFMLEKQGYRVLEADTPGEALRIAKDRGAAIDLLVSDVIMPEMNGKDLQQLLLDRYPRMRTLFISGYTADVIAQHGVLDEGVHFLPKPFSLAVLASSVREVLDQPE